MNSIKNYLMALFVFLVVDFIWLSYAAQDFYESQIGSLLKDEVNLVAATLFYLIFILGLIVFVINPSIKNHSFKKGLLLSALFGVVTYATYDLTSLAVIKDWTVLVTITDIIWGAIICSVTFSITYALGRSAKKQF
jgi:uncharacterized membrane protein